METTVKPFIKWAGGKGRLIEQINKYYPIELKEGKIKRYVEPFVGGGAIFIDILQNYDVDEVYAYDVNGELINAYNVIQNNVDELIENLRMFEKEFLKLDKEKRKEYYYEKRNRYNELIHIENENSIEKAVLFIFLNKTCFNGLYRVNKSGEFNVPMGDYKNPTICDEDNLKKLSNLIQNVNFICGDYTKCENLIDNKTFVYFDPPYRPLNATSAFTSYTKFDFDEENQIQLSNFYSKLNDNKGLLMLSNSNPKNVNEDDNFFVDNYKGFNLNEVYAARCINANGNSRGKVSELLITNY